MNQMREKQFQRLKNRHRKLRDHFPQGLSLRIHRSLSWLGRAERESDDDDAAFIFYWISFNAAYACEGGRISQSTRAWDERRYIAEFFLTLVELDRDERIYDVIWTQFPDFVRSLLYNKFVYQPFWHHHNRVEGFSSWEKGFIRSQKIIARALREKDTVVILGILFDRLYVLRNQLIHGGATWNSGVNRDQVRGGRNILARLTSIFVELMMENPELPWADGLYPVLKD